jgi:hypothetical protein
MTSRTADLGAYTLSFYGEAPGNGYVRVFTFADAQVNGCTAAAKYLGPSRDPSPFWVLQLETSHVEPAVYDIVTSLNLPPQTPHAVAYFKNVEGRHELQRHTAVGGRLIIRAAPSNEREFREAAHLSIEADLEFPVRSVRQIGCRAAGNVDGMPSATCDCTDGTHEFSCTVPPDSTDCCHDLGSPRIGVSLRIVGGSPCPILCIATAPSLLGRCGALVAQ